MTSVKSELTYAARRLALLACVAAALGCSGGDRDQPDSIDDAGVRDAGSHDTGTFIDASESDTGSPDAASDAGPSDPHRTLCDGSKSIRFYWRAEPQPARHAPGTDLLDYNGSSYLIVSGDCEYFMLPGPMAVARRGKLDPQQAEEFAKDTRYDAWPRLSGTYVPPDPGFDVDSFAVSDGSSTVRCAACNGDVWPPVWAIFGAVYEWWDRLEAQAEPLDGPLRVSALDLKQKPWGIAANPIPWPLDTPLEQLYWDVYADQTGPVPNLNLGKLLTDEVDVATLRALRAKLLEGYGDWKSYGAIPVNAPSVDPTFGLPDMGYSLVFRDVIPLEDSDGVINFSGN